MLPENIWAATDPESVGQSLTALALLKSPSGFSAVLELADFFFSFLLLKPPGRIFLITQILTNKLRLYMIIHPIKAVHKTPWLEFPLLGNRENRK